MSSCWEVVLEETESSHLEVAGPPVLGTCRLQGRHLGPDAGVVPLIDGPGRLTWIRGGWQAACLSLAGEREALPLSVSRQMAAAVIPHQIWLGLPWRTPHMVEVAAYADL